MAIRERAATAETAEATTGRMRRRGIFAGVAAMAAGLAIKHVSEAAPVSAANGGPVIIGTTNTGTSTTLRGADGNAILQTINEGAGAGVSGVSSGGVGVVGLGATGQAGVVGRGGGGNSDGVVGTGTGLFSGVAGFGAAGTSGTGVYGQGGSSGGPGLRGVYGSAAAPQYNGGVVGSGPSGGQGVSGTCNGANGWGVIGFTDSGSGIRGIASGGGNGVNGTAGTGGIGVRGVGTNSFGVLGTSTSGEGVRGNSTSGYGVLGVTTGGSASLAGISTNANIPAFAGGNSVDGGLAAVFNGTVVVNGSFVDASPGMMGSVVRHPDGTHRRVYCVEAPQSYIEDFGEGKVVNGRAEVALDPDFVALTQTDRYHVFVTPMGGDTLNLVGKTARGFTVEADATLAAMRGKKASDITATFSYRVVAAPKDDKSSRFAKFAMPKPWDMKIPATPPPPPEKTPDAPPPLAVAPPAAPTAPAAPGGDPAPAPPRR